MSVDEAKLERSVDDLRRQLVEEAQMDFSMQVEGLREEEKVDRGNKDLAFALAVLLIKDGTKRSLREGIERMEKLSYSLVQNVSQGCAERLGYNHARGTAGDVSKPEDERLTQCLYFIAMAKYKLHFYDDCIECCNKVLSVNSGLMQAQTLRALAEDNSKFTMADLGVAAGGLLAGLLLAGAAARVVRK